MYSYHDWLVMRELALLLIFVLLLSGSILLGIWKRRKQPSDTEGMVDQDSACVSRKAGASSVRPHSETDDRANAARRAA